MQLNEHDAAVSEKLTRMQADGWREIKAMSPYQLNELMDELNATGRLYNSQNPFVHLRAQAVQAINNARVEHGRAASERWFALQRRNDSIKGAAQRIREAAKMIEAVSGIPDYSEKPPAAPSLDVSTATDDELHAVLVECMKIVRAEPSKAADDAQAIALLKTPASKAIVAELKARAQADAERRAKADELSQAITAERDRRAAERAAQEAARTPESLEARIAQLEARLGDA